MGFQAQMNISDSCPRSTVALLEETLAINLTSPSSSAVITIILTIIISHADIPWRQQVVGGVPGTDEHLWLVPSQHCGFVGRDLHSSLHLHRLMVVGCNTATKQTFTPQLFWMRTQTNRLQGLDCVNMQSSTWTRKIMKFMSLTEFVCLLVASRPSNMRVYLWDGSAQTILRAATLRYKLQIKLSISPSHSILTPGWRVPVLTL